MRKFTAVTAVAAPIDVVNFDTDQLIPARFIRKPRDDSYHVYLFHDLRYDESGAERPGFVLNQPAYRESRIIVGARNFGCGSSREAAVFALDANDFRAVVAPTYGDIFFNNCFKNGMLPVVLDEAIVDGLREAGRLSGEIHASLHYGKIEEIYKLGLHEFLTRFLARNNALSTEIQNSYLVSA